MHTAQYILEWSIIAVALFGVIAGAQVGYSSYLSIFGGRDFEYKFDKSRFLLCFYWIAILATVSFVYSLIIGRQVAVALVFTVATTLFGGIGILLRVGCVPKGPKRG